MAHPRTLEMLARLDAFRGFFTGKRTLTLEQAKASFNRNRFSTDKIRETLGYEFTPLSQVVDRISKIYLKEKGTN